MTYKDDEEFEGVSSTDEISAGSKLQAERKKLQQQIKEYNAADAKQQLSKLQMSANLKSLKNQIAGQKDAEQKRDKDTKSEQNIPETFGTKTLLETEDKQQRHANDTLDAEDYIQQQKEHEEQKVESIEESSQVD